MQTTSEPGALHQRVVTAEQSTAESRRCETGNEGLLRAKFRTSKQQLRFLKTERVPSVAWHSLLHWIDREMEEAGMRPFSNPQNKPEHFIAKAVSKLRLAGNVRRSSSGPVFVTFPGLWESRTLPFSYWTEMIPYCLDCWPNEYDRWASFFKRHRIRLALFSARQSAHYFANRLPEMKSTWIPEATDPSDYRCSKLWLERDIDVLELGRKEDVFHAAIKEPLAKAKRNHLFEKAKGAIIFPDRDRLVEGLERSKISVCFPSSQTHPERSGAVETVTLRYFESMASKCIVLGHAPQELVDLFGYNPVIEAQYGHEFEQIEFILSNLGSFDDLIERNYLRLLEVGTWKIRVGEILSMISPRPTT